MATDMRFLMIPSSLSGLPSAVYTEIPISSRTYPGCGRLIDY